MERCYADQLFLSTPGLKMDHSQLHWESKCLANIKDTKKSNL